MIVEGIILFIAIVWLIVASVQDLKTTVVYNWIGFSLIAFVLGIRFFYSLNTGKWSFILFGLIGLGVLFLVEEGMYYSRLFAGGDAKILMSLGPVLFLFPSFKENLIGVLIYLIAVIFIGGIYGLSWSVFLMFKNFSKFKKEFGKMFLDNKKIAYLFFMFGIILLVFGIIDYIFCFISLLFFIFPILFLFSRAVEKVCMIEKVNPKSLILGDWLVQDVKVGGKTIKKTFEGISEKDMALLRKAKRFVYIKRGIAFVPVFLISLIIWIFYMF